MAVSSVEVLLSVGVCCAAELGWLHAINGVSAKNSKVLRNLIFMILY
ncbi:hypothetical protein l11_11680 [Neisseria weaveri LMG 5135]|nr:hypothetical protein l11_11680 [Neisseria weaveri LMG 5135]